MTLLVERSYDVNASEGKESRAELSRSGLEAIESAVGLRYADPGSPICQDTGLGGPGLVLASSVVGHDALVDLAGEEALEASNDVTFGPAVRRASGDVVDSRLMESHATGTA